MSLDLIFTRVVCHLHESAGENELSIGVQIVLKSMKQFMVVNLSVLMLWWSDSSKISQEDHMKVLVLMLWVNFIPYLSVLKSPLLRRLLC